MRRTFGVLTICAAAAGVALATNPLPATAGQGSGNPILGVSQTVLPPDRVTDITVTGSDYLVPPHAEGTDVFGGVYVFFGWVADPVHFGPSLRNSTNNDGTFGVSYAYPGDGGDANVRDDGSGVVRLVSFTPGGESGEATDYHMDANGNWTTQLRVYGSTFTTTNPATGETATYDCTQVQCGVFTIGAHGKASETNEKFVPITFAADAAVAAPAPAPTPQPTDVATTAPEATTTTTAAPTTTTAAPATTAAATAAASNTDAPPPPDGAIGATVASVETTGSSGSQIAGLLALAALVGVVAGGWRWRRRTRPQPAPVASTHPPTPGGIRP